MARTTPFVSAGELIIPTEGSHIPLESPAWYAWLADEQHKSFHFSCALGEFTARKETKQRGQFYWVAYRQCQCKLHKVYLGKTDTLTRQHLAEAAQALARFATPSGELPREDAM